MTATRNDPALSERAARWPGYGLRRERLRDYWRQLASAPIGSPMTVAVFSPRGGVGKTTTALHLGHALAMARSDLVVAVDANPDSGNLVKRLSEPHSDYGVGHLYQAAGHLDRCTDLLPYVTQAPSGLWVVRSDHEAEARPGAEEYRLALQVLSRYASVIIVDLGTGIREPVFLAVADAADALIVVAEPISQAAEAAIDALDWVEQRSHGNSRACALVVNTTAPRSPKLDAGKLAGASDFYVDQVLQVPYDPHLATGDVCRWALLSRHTQDAYLQLGAAVMTLGTVRVGSPGAAGLQRHAARPAESPAAAPQRDDPARRVATTTRPSAERTLPSDTMVSRPQPDADMPVGQADGAGGGHGREGRRRWLARPRWIAALTALILIAAGVGSWALVSESGSHASGMAMPSRPKRPSALMSALMVADKSGDAKGQLPPSSCKQQGATQATCTAPAPGIDGVVFKTYPSLNALYAAYVARVRSLNSGQFQQNYRDCGIHETGGEVSWNHQFQHPRDYSVAQSSSGKLADAQAVGRVFCNFVNGEETMVWTQNDGHLLARVTGPVHEDVWNWWVAIHHNIGFGGSAMHM
jgi:MinD-like ATPase involved in chromosome partitioning or flagellar assembly